MLVTKSRDDLNDLHRKKVSLQRDKLTLEYYYGIAYPEKTTQGAQLRSAKLIINKPTIAQKVSNVFKEMGLSEKLAMPTSLVCEKMEKLQGAIQLMLDAKKNVDRADQELRIAITRKDGT